MNETYSRMAELLYEQRSFKRVGPGGGLLPKTRSPAEIEYRQRMSSQRAGGMSYAGKMRGLDRAEVGEIQHDLRGISTRGTGLPPRVGIAASYSADPVTGHEPGSPQHAGEQQPYAKRVGAPGSQGRKSHRLRLAIQKRHRTEAPPMSQKEVDRGDFERQGQEPYTPKPASENPSRFSSLGPAFQRIAARRAKRFR